jgi:hypothetical protein
MKKKAKLSIFTYLFLVLLILIFLSLVGVCIYGAFNVKFANDFWFNIKRPINDLLFLNNQNFPITNLIQALLVGLLIISPISVICMKLLKTKFLYNFSTKVFFLTIFVIMSYFVISATKLNDGMMSFMKDNPHSKDEYTIDDVVKLDNYLKTKLLELAPKIKREDYKVKIDNPEVMAINDLKKLSSEYSFLKGEYVTKYKELTKEMDEYEDSYGLTNNLFYKVYINFEEQDDIELLDTITHELCHTKGIYREVDAEFCSILAGINSDEDVSKYSAYLEAYKRVHNAINDIDPNKAEYIEDDVVRECLFNTYYELCMLNNRETTEYKENSPDTLEIKTYMLKNYKEYNGHLYKLIDDMNGIINDIEYKVDGKKVTKEEIDSLIQTGSDKFLIINIKIDKEKYDKINEIIKDYIVLFKSIKQLKNNEEEKKNNVVLKENELLKPFDNKSDYLKIAEYEVVDSEKYYDYGRVTRLLLEYFNDEIKK